MASQTKTTTSQLPPFVEEPLKELLERANTLSKESYLPYKGGPRIAPFSPFQQRAFQMAGSGVGVASSPLKYALQQTQQFSQPIGQRDISRYFDPYNQSVTQTTLQEMSRQNALLGDQNRSRVGQLGAFGNSRVGLVESEQNRNFMDQVARTVAGLNSQNYSQALTTAQGQQQVGLAGAAQAGNVGLSMQESQAKDVNDLMRLGTAQQGQTQQNLALAYQDFLEQRQHPYGQLGFLSNLIQGAPVPTSTVSEQKSGSNVLGQILGLITAAGGLFF